MGECYFLIFLSQTILAENNFKNRSKVTYIAAFFNMKYLIRKLINCSLNPLSPK